MFGIILYNQYESGFYEEKLVLNVTFNSPSNFNIYLPLLQYKTGDLAFSYNTLKDFKQPVFFNFVRMTPSTTNTSAIFLHLYGDNANFSLHSNNLHFHEGTTISGEDKIFKSNLTANYYFIITNSSISISYYFSVSTNYCSGQEQLLVSTMYHPLNPTLQLVKTNTWCSLKKTTSVGCS